VILKPSLPRKSFRVYSWDEPTAEPSAVWLTPFEETLLKALDGLTPALECGRRLGVDIFRLRFALHRLLSAGLAEPVSPALPPQIEGEEIEASSPEETTEAPRRIRLPALLETLAARDEADAPGLTEMRSYLAALSVGWSAILGIAVIVPFLVGSLAGSGSRLLTHPFPWQESARAGLELAQRRAVYAKVERALVSFHILNGRFPGELLGLAQLSLLAPEDERGKEGLELSFSPTEEGFVLGLRETADYPSRYLKSFSASGNFLLDPGFTRVLEKKAGKPLRLLE